MLSEKLIFSTDHKPLLPYVADFYKSKAVDNSKEIDTTIDYGLSKKVDDIAKNALYELSWKNVRDY